MASAIHIDTVEQIDLPPIRPGRGWYALGSIVIGAGLVAGFFLLASGAFGYLRDLGDLAEVDVPGQTAVDLPRGVITVYHEPQGGPVLVPGDDVLEIRDPTGAVVERRPPATGDQYAVEGRRGWAVAEFDAPVEGRYEVLAAPALAESTGVYRVGPSPTERLTAFGIAGLVVAASALLAGIVVLLVVRRRRARSIAARLALQKTRPTVERLA